MKQRKCDHRSPPRAVVAPRLWSARALLNPGNPLCMYGGGGVIVHSAWGCVLWVAQWRAARALDSQLEWLVGPV